MPPRDMRMTSSTPVPYAEVSQSAIYSMIPSVVRSRIPVLTSLRHTARTVVLQGSRVRRGGYDLYCADKGKEKDSYSSASTTDSSRASTPTLRSESPERNIRSRELSMAISPVETRSGVDWEVALSGVRLWVIAKSQADQGGDPIAMRSMHIDALRYMHMALPPDLTGVEIQSLRASMSPQLITGTPGVAEHYHHREPSILRQSIARVVCWLVAGLLLMLPVFMTFLDRLLRFEREHQVTERVITSGLELTSTLGERGIVLQQAMVRFKDGRVGGACVGMGSWFVEGVVGGINDGLDAVAQSRRKAP